MTWAPWGLDMYQFIVVDGEIRLQWSEFVSNWISRVFGGVS